MRRKNLIAKFSTIRMSFKLPQNIFKSSIFYNDSYYQQKSLPDVFAIIERLSFGLLFYRNDGALLYSNSPARDFFQSSVPLSTVEFITRYGNESDVNAAFLLQEGERYCSIEINRRKLSLHIRDFYDNNETKIGLLITIQDITDSEALESQRKQFVANVSHELKTPLTTIKTYSESLLDWGLEEKNDETIRKDISRIYEDALRMEQLVADLLLLSSIDSRGMRYSFSETDITRLCRQVLDRLKSQADLKNISLDLISLSVIPPTIADYNAMERVITNLITNAIKYSDDGTQIIIYLSCPMDNVHINVSDKGYGIASQHLPHLFDRFYRVDVTGNRKYGGTGLGLAIAKELVELHHGRITVRSSLGKGSSFHIFLPSAGIVYKEALKRAREGQLIEEDVLLSYASKELILIANDLDYKVENLTELKDNEVEDIISFISPEHKNDYSAHREELELLNDTKLIEEQNDMNKSEIKDKGL